MKVNMQRSLPVIKPIWLVAVLLTVGIVFGLCVLYGNASRPAVNMNVNAVAMSLHNQIRESAARTLGERELVSKFAFMTNEGMETIELDRHATRLAISAIELELLSV